MINETLKWNIIPIYLIYIVVFLFICILIGDNNYTTHIDHMSTVAKKVANYFQALDSNKQLEWVFNESFRVAESVWQILHWKNGPTLY